MLKYLTLLMTVLFVNVATATITLQLQSEGQYSKETRSVIATYLKEVESFLPPSIPFLQKTTIFVSFEKMAGSAAQMLNPQNMNVKMGAMSLISLKNKIILNQNILSLYGKSFYADAKSYRHITGRRLAIATLLHEISHVIDTETSFSEPLKEEIRRCKDPRNHPDYKAEYFPTCNHALSARGKISDHPDFNRHVRWDKLQKSENHPGSPNSYEFENANEFFAVNFEYFLMDPEFQCRRPAIFNLFKKIFSWSPQTAKECHINHEIFFHNKVASINIAPTRVLAISYLHAGKGTATMSRWGHSMLQLTVCKRDLQNTTDLCSRNTQEVVIGFQAEITNNIINNFDGLFGKYSSKLFVLDQKQVINDYTKNEFRDVTRHKINLSKSQQEELIYKILESYWGYAGKYYFLTNNCASEAFSLIKSILPSAHSFTKEVISTPIGLLASLHKSQLIEKEETQKFPSYKKTLNLALKILASANSNMSALDFEAYSALAPLERYRLLPSEKSVKEIAAFQVLEGFILAQKTNELDTKSFDIAIKNKIKISPAATDFSFISGATYTYGIPFTEEITSMQKYQTMQDAVSAHQQNLLQTYSKNFPDLRHDITQIEDNLRRVRDSH